MKKVTMKEMREKIRGLELGFAALVREAAVPAPHPSPVFREISWQVFFGWVQKKQLACSVEGPDSHNYEDIEYKIERGHTLLVFTSGDIAVIQSNYDEGCYSNDTLGEGVQPPGVKVKIRLTP